MVTQLHIHVHMCVYVCVYIYTHIMCVCVYIYTYIYMYIYVYVYICIPHTMEYYLAIKKNDILPLAATWLELENLIVSEMSQKDKDKYHMISLITGI